MSETATEHRHGPPDASGEGHPYLPAAVRERLPQANARAAAVIASLPPPSEAAQALLRTAHGARSAGARVQWLHRAADAWVKDVEPVSACRRGCSHCCHIPVAISDVEARLIGQASGRAPVRVTGAPTAEEVMEGATLPGTPRGDDYSAPCPFLAAGRCSIYAVRPLACRVQVNLDEDDLLCQLQPGGAVPVPYLDATRLKASYVMVQPAARWADIRAFFPSSAAEAAPGRCE